MKKLILKESQAPYHLSLDESLLAEGPVVLEKEGRPVAVLVPIDEYETFRVWRENQVRRHGRLDQQIALDREHNAFEKMLPDLLKQHRGRVVAIHNGEVIEVGDDKMKVWERARQKLGGAVVYVQVVDYPPRVYKVPYRRIVR